MHTCPVCGYAQLEFPPEDFTICPSCGTEFGYQDTMKSHEQLRAEWIASGPLWHSRVIRPPAFWNPFDQLIQAGFGADLPYLDGLRFTQVVTYASLETITPVNPAEIRELAFR